MTRVLIVDDNAEFTRMFGRLLTRAGFEVEELTTPLGVNARLLQRTPPIDILVLDCIMPALPGPQLLSLLANNERTAAIPVLLISGVSEQAYDDAIRKHPRARWSMKHDPVVMIEHVRELAESLAA